MALLSILFAAFAVILLNCFEKEDPLIASIQRVLGEKAFPPPNRALLEKLNRSNIEKQLRIIDPYARYVLPQESTEDSRPTKYLGVELFSYRSRFWARTVPGGSADIAGLPEIGILHSIDGRDISDLDLKKVSGLLDEALKANAVSLTVSSEANSQRKTHRISPSNTKPSSIVWNRFGATTVVVRIANFVSHETAPRLLSLYKTMNWEKGQVIIDLRGCSGGDLFEAIQIAGFFVPDGLPMVQLHDRSGEVQIYRAPSGTKRSTPAALVIDRHTASAAEVFAGILQYHKLTRLVGEASYGKCLSQTAAPLVNGGTLWFTNILILFPDLHSCTEKGLLPDIFIDDVMVMKMDEILARLSKN